MSWSRFLLVLFISAALNSCGSANRYRQHDSDGANEGREFPEDCSRDTIEESLKCIPGLAFEELKAIPPRNGAPDQDAKPIPQGYRLFEVQFTQPADHALRSGEVFQQKLMLWHTDVKKPMVLQTSGYSIYSVNQAEITQLFGANQLQVEHRFFLKSKPASGDWSKLTVEQSAKDFHRVAEAFHSIYKKKWVNTGASKGGMTSVYHRYFYPSDVDATVAYVAPSSHALLDDRYNAFLDDVGNNDFSSCRARLAEFQRALLKRKAEVLPFVDGDYTMIGGKDLAYEYATSELFFTFWQYQPASSACSEIPGSNASTEQLADGLARFNDVSEYGDKTLEEFNPYFYQAALELGAATPRLSNIADLVTHPADEFTLKHVVPAGTNPVYDGALVRRIEDWATANAPTTMFIYGTFDSWYAAAFPKPNDARDSHLFLAKAGNHGTKIRSLSSADAKAAKSLLAGWLDAALVEPAKLSGVRHSSDNGQLGLTELTTEDVQFLRRR